MKDEEIIDLYWSRNENAILESQNSYGKYCYSIAIHILHDADDSDECVNDTWLRAWNAIPPERPNKLAIFLGTITRNLSFDKYKAKNAAKRGNGAVEAALDELAECVPDKNTVEDQVIAAELSRSINAFLRTLPERECNVFLRRYWYSEEYNEIAERYDMKLNTVKTILFRTRTKLKEYLEKEGVAL